MYSMTGSELHNYLAEQPMVREMLITEQIKELEGAKLKIVEKGCLPENKRWNVRQEMIDPKSFIPDPANIEEWKHRMVGLIEPKLTILRLDLASAYGSDAFPDLPKVC